MISFTRLVEALATAWSLPPWTEESLVERASLRLGKRWRWIRPLVRTLIQNHPVQPAERHLLAVLAQNESLHRAWQSHDLELHSVIWRPSRVVEVRPAAFACTPPLPQLANLAALEAWLGITRARLEWYTRSWGDPASRGPLAHYRYRWVPKRSGGMRLLEAPKDKLKHIQRELLFGILALPPLHDAAHAFRGGRSVRSFVAPHAGQDVVLRLDLEHFFSSLTHRRVRGVFGTLGYGASVAQALAGLCTSRVPEDVLQQHSLDPRQRRLLAARHLPQGAPTSPALANLWAYSLDVRLSAYAAAAGAKYTRYADDLLFSGGSDLARSARRFLIHAAAICAEEGFVVHPRKTRVMCDGVRQHAAGLVLNEKPNIDRRDYDELKAILTNCVRHGPSSQNRGQHPDFRAHLSGRIAWVAQINPARGEKLHSIFRRIHWQ